MTGLRPGSLFGEKGSAEMQGFAGRGRIGGLVTGASHGAMVRRVAFGAGDRFCAYNGIDHERRMSGASGAGRSSGSTEGVSMLHQVTVSFDLQTDFVFRFERHALGAMTPEEARRWFDLEYSALDCAPPSGVGKVLVIDKILDVARQSGPQRFGADVAWGDCFARHTALVLGRELIRVDVSAYAVTYGAVLEI